MCFFRKIESIEQMVVLRGEERQLGFWLRGEKRERELMTNA